MASLKEIKNRIGSVKSTLKITSAIKMVASVKLHHAQMAIGNLLPYEKKLTGILGHLMESAMEPGPYEEDRKVKSVAVLACASNSSLCGAYNSNVIKQVKAVLDEYGGKGIPVTVYSVGKKMSEAMRKIGAVSPEDLTGLAAKPDYAGAAALAERLMKAFLSGKYDRVELVYTHYRSTSSHVVRRETYLPFSVEEEKTMAGDASADSAALDDFILEPGRGELFEKLLPMVMCLKIYTVLLDASESEYAARTMAMQTATDNGNDLLQELTLEYNKGRQQKITNEILDIVGGSAS